MTIRTTLLSYCFSAICFLIFYVYEFISFFHGGDIHDLILCIICGMIFYLDMIEAGKEVNKIF